MVLKDFNLIDRAPDVDQRVHTLPAPQWGESIQDYADAAVEYVQAFPDSYQHFAGVFNGRIITVSRDTTAKTILRKFWQSCSSSDELTVTMPKELVSSLLTKMGELRALLDRSV